MNATEFLNDNMTLDEKLKAIDEAMKLNQTEFKKANPSAAPLDPSELTMCAGCQ